MSSFFTDAGQRIRSRQVGFLTKFPAVCGRCGEQIPVGGTAHYGDGDELTCASCMDADAAADASTGATEGAIELDEFRVSATQTRDLIALTMPRGATAADRCPVCFQIPASNGRCWC